MCTLTPVMFLFLQPLPCTWCCRITHSPDPFFQHCTYKFLLSLLSQSFSSSWAKPSTFEPVTWSGWSSQSLGSISIRLPHSRFADAALIWSCCWSLNLIPDTLLQYWKCEWVETTYTKSCCTVNTIIHVPTVIIQCPLGCELQVHQDEHSSCI